MAYQFNWAGDVRAGGLWFRDLRQKRGKTTRDVAKEVGIAQQSISSIETGGIAKPAMAMLVDLGRYYGVTPNQIARAYGMWKGPLEEADKRDERLVFLDAVLSKLSPGERYTLLQQVMAMATLADQQHQP